MRDRPPLESWAHSFGRVTPAEIREAKLEPIQVPEPEPPVREVDDDRENADEDDLIDVEVGRVAYDREKVRRANLQAMNDEAARRANAVREAAATLVEALGYERAAVQVQGNEHSTQITVSELTE